MPELTRQIEGIGAVGFPTDLERHPLLAWMGDDRVRFVTLELLGQFRERDPGTEMLRIACEGPPELETRVRGAGSVTGVELRLSLQVHLRDSAGRHWRLRGTGAFQPHATSFQVGSTEGPAEHERMVEVLREARGLVSRPGNDFSWCSWRDAEHARREIDDLIDRLESGAALPDRVAILFAPTGPMQELSEAGCWGEEFAALANRCDAALGVGHALHATFTCGVCGEQAGEIELEGGEPRRISFTGTLTQPVQSESLELLRAALAAGDAGGLFSLDPEYAPFYCPACTASYCGAHWDRWDVFDDDVPDWHDSIRGRCPRGHERMRPLGRVDRRDAGNDRLGDELGERQEDGEHSEPDQRPDHPGRVDEQIGAGRPGTKTG